MELIEKYAEKLKTSRPEEVSVVPKKMPNIKNRIK